ncbi:hypothetical protein BJ546DRAFT_856839 [Cryomyces antarcticus]
MGFRLPQNAVPPEQEASYSAMIDSILATSDLNTISAKKIRKGLQAAVDYDLTPQKDVITQLIMSRFDRFNSGKTKPAPPSPPATAPATEAAPATNGTTHKRAKSTSPLSSQASQVSPAKRAKVEEDSELSDVVDSPPPKKKKRKTAPKGEDDDDAAFAARLQAEENSRARPTRGGATRKRTSVKKEKKATTRKKKSSNKVRADDDSDVESGSGEEKKVERKGGFHKPMTLSEPLSQLLGETSLSRPQTVKKIWEYVKARDLQDPSDKRQIRCDEALRAVFKQDRVHMFTMNKILALNLYAQDE